MKKEATYCLLSVFEMKNNAPSSINSDKGDITYYSPWGNVAIFYEGFRQSSGQIRIVKIDGSVSLLQVSGSIGNVCFELIEIQD